MRLPTEISLQIEDERKGVAVVANAQHDTSKGGGGSDARLRNWECWRRRRTVTAQRRFSIAQVQNPPEHVKNNN
jgi:hypothetical protein